MPSSFWLSKLWTPAFDLPYSILSKADKSAMVKKHNMRVCACVCKIYTVSHLLWHELSQLLLSELSDRSMVSVVHPQKPAIMLEQKYPFQKGTWSSPLLFFHKTKWFLIHAFLDFKTKNASTWCVRFTISKQSNSSYFFSGYLPKDQLLSFSFVPSPQLLRVQPRDCHVIESGHHRATKSTKTTGPLAELLAFLPNCRYRMI